jgi:hypothetical protein
VIQHLEARHPEFAGRVDQLRNRVHELHASPAAQSARDAARQAFTPLTNGHQQPPSASIAPVDPFQLAPPSLPYGQEIDTAQRPPGYYPQ